MERITDIADGRLDMYARLTDVQLRSHLESEHGIFVAESAKVVARALDAGYEPVSLVVPDHRLVREGGLVARFEEAGYPVFCVPREELAKLAGFEVTRGVLAAMRRKRLPEVRELLESARRVAVLEDVTNHANVGSVFRNAAALGLDAVLVSPECCDPLYRRAVRVSMGTVFQVPWVRLEGEDGRWLDDAMRHLREAGFATCALALRDDAVALDDPALKRHGKLAMFFGTEGGGLADATIEACDHVVVIPMRHGVDSLNVAATSAVAFWELARERRR